MSNQVQHWCGPKPDDPSPIIYHGGIAGPPANPAAFVEANQARFCASYFQVRRGVPDFEFRHGRRFLDSGAFSYLNSPHKMVKEEEYLDEYSKWLLANKVPLDFYITFDHRPDAALTYRVTQALRERER